MKTIRVLSNISYNSYDFFVFKINEFYERGLIDWCYWILHTPEEDEEKEHIHFVFKPSTRIDTMDFRQMLYEYDGINPKPLTCTPKFEPTNSMDDWLLYAVHDIPYLRSKGQWRKFHYDYKDLCATDKTCLKQDWDKINRNKFYVLDFLQQAVDDNVPFFELVQNGIVPISQRAQYEFQYNALFRSKTAEINRETMRKLSHELHSSQLVENQSFDDIF